MIDTATGIRGQPVLELYVWRNGDLNFFLHTYFLKPLLRPPPTLTLMGTSNRTSQKTDEMKTNNYFKT